MVEQHIPIPIVKSKAPEQKSPVFEAASRAQTTFFNAESSPLFSQQNADQMAEEEWFKKQGIDKDNPIVQAEIARRQKTQESLQTFRNVITAQKGENGSTYNSETGEYVLIGPDGKEIAKGRLQDAYPGMRYGLEILVAEAPDEATRKEAQDALTAMDKFWAVQEGTNYTAYSDWATRTGLDEKARTASGMSADAWSKADAGVKSIWRGKVETEEKVTYGIADESITTTTTAKEPAVTVEDEIAQFEKAKEHAIRKVFFRAESSPLFSQQNADQMAEEEWFKKQGIDKDNPIIQAEIARRKTAQEALQTFRNVITAQTGENGSTYDPASGEYVLKGPDGKDIAKGRLQDAYPGMRYGLEILVAEAPDEATRKEAQDALTAMDKFWAVQEGDTYISYSDWAAKVDLDGKARAASGMSADAWSKADVGVKNIWKAKVEMDENVVIRLRSPLSAKEKADVELAEKIENVKGKIEDEIKDRIQNAQTKDGKRIVEDETLVEQMEPDEVLISDEMLLGAYLSLEGPTNQLARENLMAQLHRRLSKSHPELFKDGLDMQVLVSRINAVNTRAEEWLAGLDPNHPHKLPEMWEKNPVALLAFVSACRRGGLIVQDAPNQSPHLTEKGVVFFEKLKGGGKLTPDDATFIITIATDKNADYADGFLSEQFGISAQDIFNPNNRRKYAQLVIDDMLNNGKITKEEYAICKKISEHQMSDANFEKIAKKFGLPIGGGGILILFALFAGSMNDLMNTGVSAGEGGREGG